MITKLCWKSAWWIPLLMAYIKPTIKLFASKICQQVIVNNFPSHESPFQTISKRRTRKMCRFMGFNKRKCQKRFYTPIPYEGIQSMIYAYFRSQLVGFTTRFWGSTCCERDDTWDRILHQDRKKNIVFLQSCSKSLGYTTLLLLLFLLFFY